MTDTISYLTGSHTEHLLTQNDWDKHVAGRLKVSEHKLNDRQYQYVKSIVDAHMDSDRLSERGGVNKKEVEQIVHSLQDRKNYDVHRMSPKQIAHVEKTLMAQI